MTIYHHLSPEEPTFLMLERDRGSSLRQGVSHQISFPTQSGLYYPCKLSHRGYRGGPRTIVTDKLRSYGVAHRKLIPEMIHSTKQCENNRAEQSHQDIRVRERVMRRFKSVGQVQRLLGTQAAVSNLFNLGSALADWSRAVA
jgi:hypothetical protein